MPLISVGDLSINYDERGSGDPLLLIMGFGASSAGWRPEFVDGLAESFRVITFDNRGTGQSEAASAPYTMADMADDAVGVLEKLGIERAHVMGLSMGGMIAQEVALRHPRRVRGLVLGCTNSGAPLSVAAPQESVALLMPPEGMSPEDAARRAWPVVQTPEFIAANPELMEASLTRAMQHPTPLQTRHYQMGAVMTWGTADRLTEIAAPTLIITGDRDVLIPPENSRILHERIPGSRLEVIPDAAHGFTTSHPAETVALVTEFLSEVSAAAATGDAMTTSDAAATGGA